MRCLHATSPCGYHQHHAPDPTPRLLAGQVRWWLRPASISKASTSSASVGTSARAHGGTAHSRASCVRGVSRHREASWWRHLNRTCSLRARSHQPPLAARCGLEATAHAASAHAATAHASTAHAATAHAAGPLELHSIDEPHQPHQGLSRSTRTRTLGGSPRALSRRAASPMPPMPPVCPAVVSSSLGIRLRGPCWARTWATRPSQLTKPTLSSRAGRTRT